MFLSTENPQHDPLSPSSSNLLRLNNTSSDKLGQSHLSNFSIRDYAYSNRKKNIKNNWPFSTKSLHLLSAHGVTNPLPPFQKFSNQFQTTASSSSRKQTVSHIAETSKGVCSQSRIIKNGLSKVEIVVAATSNNSKSKKCGRGGVMVKSKEDGSGGLVTASESVMASKTCPICRTFSSASNTTLNAHIDQCLSVDSAVPPLSSKPSKPRVNQCLSVDSAVPHSKPSKPRVNSVVPPASSKPRGKPRMKVKTMVDIYASAKGCTLEDLDKRNGTQWASVLSCTNRVADKTEVSKKRKASPVGIGPVYIDAKGQKLRILTEFSEKKTSTTSGEEQEDGSSEKKSSSQGSKENIKRGKGKKHGKYIKLTSHKAKEKVPGEGSSKGHRRIYNQRMLAKRGLTSKKLRDNKPSEDDNDDDDDEWSGEERLVLRGNDLNKKKLRSQVSGRSKIVFESKRSQRGYLNSVHLKKNLGSIQEDKNVREAPRATSMRNLSPPIVANGWRRLSPHVEELKRARLDLSDEEEEETGKWESEMTQEVELSDDDYVSGDNGEEINEVLRRSSPSFTAYDDYDDDEETSEEEEEEDNTKKDNVLDTPPCNEIIPSEEERAMYYSEEVENMIYKETEDVRFDKGSLYVEVDNIPIPGPPGSFLPSPRGMGFDEHLGNSSVITTSQFHSSMDRNSSESPVSNFPAGRLNFQTELSSSLDIPLSYSTTPMSFCVPSHHGTNPEAEDSHESCCCQRKKRMFSLNHQTSHLLQRRADMKLTNSPTRLDQDHPFEQSQYVIQQDLDLHSKISNRAVVPQSPSNSVLRLMGKDLMVMNQGDADNNNEETSRGILKPTPQFHDPQACAGLYLRNSFESTPKAQQQTQTQASPFRNSFDYVRYFPPT